MARSSLAPAIIRAVDDLASLALAPPPYVQGVCPSKEPRCASRAPTSWRPSNRSSAKRTCTRRTHIDAVTIEYA